MKQRFDLGASLSVDLARDIATITRIYARRPELRDLFRELARESRPTASPVGPDVALHVEAAEAFLDQCCVVTGQASDGLSAAELRRAFLGWLDRSELAPWTERKIGLVFAELARSWRCPKTGRRFIRRKSSRMTYQGVRLHDSMTLSLSQGDLFEGRQGEVGEDE